MKIRKNIMAVMVTLLLSGTACELFASPQSTPVGTPTTTASVSPTSAPSSSATTPAASREAAVAALLKPIDGVTYLPDSVVGMALSTTDQDLHMEPTAGALASTNAWVTVLFYADFPGQHAKMQIADAHPSIHIKLGSNPEGRVFLVKTESNVKTDNRSLKMGRSGWGHASSATTPDKDWIVSSAVKEDSPNLWTLTPTADLAPGEYGVFVARAGSGTLSGDLYDFAVVAK
ncbi:MAG: hypothetical protein WA777_12865 [Rhodanobacter sp.]